MAMNWNDMWILIMTEERVATDKREIFSQHLNGTFMAFSTVHHGSHYNHLQHLLFVCAMNNLNIITLRCKCSHHA